VIGAGGKNIQQIEATTSARLSTKSEDSSHGGVQNGPRSFDRDWIYITITGSGKEIDRAKKLLVINIMEATQNSASANGQGSSSGGYQKKNYGHNNSRGGFNKRGGFRGGRGRGGYIGKNTRSYHANQGSGRRGRGGGRGGYRGRGRGSY